MNQVAFWDFDGTLALRPGMWRGCLSEILDEHEPGHRISPEDLRPWLQGGFPWHRPDVAHTHLCEPDAWWQPIEELLARAYRGVGLLDERARELARLARRRYVDPTVGWQLYDDTLPALTSLRTSGWRHVIISNHVPELSQLVESLGLAELIDAVFTSALTGYEKPHPVMFDTALQHCGSPTLVWMIGDNPIADVAGAEAAGIPAILVRGRRQAGTRYAPDLAAVQAILEAERP